eukprot:jgi/Bigna1/132144/aug1.16_g6852
MLVSTYIALYTFDSNPNEAPSSCGQCSRSSSHRETFPNQWNTWIRDQPRVTAKVHFGKRGGFDDGHSKLVGTGSTVATPPLNRRRSSLPPWERRHRTLAGDSDDEGKDGQKIGMKLFEKLRNSNFTSSRDDPMKWVNEFKEEMKKSGGRYRAIEDQRPTPPSRQMKKTLEKIRRSMSQNGDESLNQINIDDARKKLTPHSLAFLSNFSMVDYLGEKVRQSADPERLKRFKAIEREFFEETERTQRQQQEQQQMEYEQEEQQSDPLSLYHGQGHKYHHRRQALPAHPEEEKVKNKEDELEKEEEALLPEPPFPDRNMLQKLRRSEEEEEEEEEEEDEEIQKESFGKKVGREYTERIHKEGGGTTLFEDEDDMIVQNPTNPNPGPTKRLKESPAIQGSNNPAPPQEPKLGPLDGSLSLNEEDEDEEDEDMAERKVLSNPIIFFFVPAIFDGSRCSHQDGDFNKQEILSAIQNNLGSSKSSSSDDSDHDE